MSFRGNQARRQLNGIGGGHGYPVCSYGKGAFLKGKGEFKKEGFSQIIGGHRPLPPVSTGLVATALQIKGKFLLVAFQKKNSILSLFH